MSRREEMYRGGNKRVNIGTVGDGRRRKKRSENAAER